MYALCRHPSTISQLPAGFNQNSFRRFNLPLSVLLPGYDLHQYIRCLFSRKEKGTNLLTIQADSFPAESSYSPASLLRRHFELQDPTSVESRMTMAKNVLQVVVWGAWFLMSLSILGISFAWLMVVTGGLSTGIGFASKDIIENIYYGISLMTGRIKVVASKSVTEASKGALGPIGNRP